MMIQLSGSLFFKIRFNTAHNGSGFFWRIIIDEKEYLAIALHCNVPTFSEASFDKNANEIKYHIAGNCTSFILNEDKIAFLK